MEHALGKKAERKLLPMQMGDVPATFANTDLLQALADYRPATSVNEGVPRFVAWYREHYSFDA